MRTIQDYIHALEEGSSKWIITSIFSVVLFAGLAVAYDLRLARNLGTSEAMDAAQLARNISEGKGFTTQNIRPLTMSMLKAKAKADGQAEGPGADLVRLRSPHPDLANAPLYPLMLAGFMKVGAVANSWHRAITKDASKVTTLLATPLTWIPEFNYEITDPRKSQFLRHQPDYLIHVINQLLFGVAALLLFRIARRAFDVSVAWVSLAVFVGTEVFWRYSASGLPTMLLIVLLLALVWTLMRLEEMGRATQSWLVASLVLAALAGLLLGAGALTRYSFGWLAIPAVVFTLVMCGSRRLVVSAVMLAVFLSVLSPWLVRNYQLSGTLFGTPGYALAIGSGATGAKMERTLEPGEELAKVGFHGYRDKLLGNLITIFQNELPKLGGSLVGAFFLAGLLLPFRTSGPARLRVFLLMALAVFIVVQAMGRTHLSAESPELNTENLLVLLTPLAFVFGVGMVHLLLGQVRLPMPEARLLLLIAFAVIVSLPLMFGIARARTSPLAYPPYYPPYIQQVSGWMEEGELIMSDIPAGVAWYGRRQCVGFTPDMDRDFFGINDYHKPIKALYLTAQTTDARFLTEFVGTEMRLWGMLFLQSLIQREVPAKFPLRVIAPGFFPSRLADQLLITDRERWRKATPE